MSKAVIGGYEIRDDGTGSLIFEEKATGETITVDGDDLYSKIRSDELQIKPANGTTDYINQQPLDSAVRQGYIVGRGGGYYTIIDPEDYSDHASALQATVDELVSNTSSAGEVHFYSKPKGGGSWDIGTTVVFAKSGQAILPYGHGFNGAGSGRYLRCSITDGSPMFQIGDGSNQWGGQQVKFGGFSAIGNNNDAEFIRMVNGNHWKLNNIHAKEFGVGSNNDGVIVVDGDCYTWGIDNFTWLAGDNTADLFNMVYQNGLVNNDGPGYGYLGPGFQCNGSCRTAVTTSCDNSPIIFNGYIENAGNASQGTAAIHMEQGGIAIGPESRFAGNHHEQVYFDGDQMYACPGFVTNLLDGNENIFHIGSTAGQFHIQPYYRIGSIAGNEIVIDDSPSNGSVIPYSHQLNGSISGDDTAKIYKPDGWQLVAERTGVTINAGTSEVNNIGGAGGQTPKVDVTLTSASGSGATVNTQVKYDHFGNGNVGIVLEETSGSADAVVDYKLYDKPMTDI